jgi:U3 small nucleolar RNA-associated protein 7
VDINAAKKKFDLKLAETGPYYVDYTRNGRFLLLGGKKGHIFMCDWMNMKPYCEININETGFFF